MDLQHTEPWGLMCPPTASNGGGENGAIGKVEGRDGAGSLFWDTWGAGIDWGWTPQVGLHTHQVVAPDGTGNGLFYRSQKWCTGHDGSFRVSLLID